MGCETRKNADRETRGHSQVASPTEPGVRSVDTIAGNRAWRNRPPLGDGSRPGDGPTGVRRTADRLDNFWFCPFHVQGGPAHRSRAAGGRGPFSQSDFLQKITKETKKKRQGPAGPPSRSNTPGALAPQASWAMSFRGWEWPTSAPSASPGKTASNCWSASVTALASRSLTERGPHFTPALAAASGR